MTTNVDLQVLVDAVVAALDAKTGPGPLLVGISGAVGVGKSTAAATLADALGAAGVRAEVVCTDGFLRTNDDLAAAKLKMRKGFPESFDDALLTAVLGRLRSGDGSVDIPEYSHVVYDRVPGPGRRLGSAAVVIIEGVNALQSPVIEHLDIAIYLDADEPVLRDWFTTRFLEMCAEAEADPEGESFYRMFLAHDEPKRRAIAARTWDEVNGVNLQRHIAPSRARASYLVEKNADHSIRSITAAA